MHMRGTSRLKLRRRNLPKSPVSYGCSAPPLPPCAYRSSRSSYSRTRLRNIGDGLEARPQWIGPEDDIEIATDGLPWHDSMAGLITGRVNYKVGDLQGLVALWHYSVMYRYALAVDSNHRLAKIAF